MVVSQLKAGVETRAGALLTGARGSGKTASARAAFDELAPGFERAAWITGTAADSRVPFGAFERLFTVPETGRTIQVLRAAREALGTGLLLVVDDGHLLDRLSASLVYQLAVSGAARVIVTAESNQSLPEGISSLVRDRLVVPVTADEPVHAVVTHDSAPPPPEGDGVVGRLRRAVRALDGGDALPVAELAAAADDALRLGDLELAERLGRAALPAGGLAARVTLSYALAWQGRGGDADAVLAGVDAAALTEPALMMWALPRAANQFWMLSEPERATAFLRTVRSRVQTPAAQVTVDALSATFAMNAGNLNRAMQLADSVLASADPSDTAVGWAASAAALSCARTGRLTEVDGFAERALAAGQPGLLRFTSGFGQTTALLLAGEPDKAQQLAQELIDFTQSQQPGRAIGEVLLADVLIARGELEVAIEVLQDAAKVLARTGYSWGPLAWMLLARALGQHGATAEAGRALTRAEARHGLKSMLFAPELALARAWTNAARRDRHGAIAAAREALRAAERGGQSAVALRVLHDAAVLGDVRAADCFDRVGVDCAFGRQARAVAAEVAADRA
ncbi:AAA family ATPase [Mycolicibacterium phocaicum]|nr:MULTISPECIES: AAA family ATPase [Mycolicibacterium]UCZ61666.1 AAA family ATPase [Mycolicibacterium phocaicum]SHU75254.1 ATPase [Mycobacteroides abscessus subsp. abscessus]